MIYPINEGQTTDSVLIKSNKIRVSKEEMDYTNEHKTRENVTKLLPILEQTLVAEIDTFEMLFI